MKKFIILLLCTIPFYSFSQVDKIGYSKSQLLNSMSAEPCKSTYNDIWYCVENGSMIVYDLKNDFVSSVMYMDEYSSKAEANIYVNNEINKAKQKYGRPTMKGDEAYWFSGDFRHCWYGIAYQQ
jgi:hypothetical protein